jgi:hypothetical protein
MESSPRKVCQDELRWGLKRKSGSGRVWRSLQKQQRQHLENVWGSNGDKYQQRRGTPGTGRRSLRSRNPGYDKLIIEGDSQIIINMFKSLQHGSPTSKITKNWHLEASLEAIQQMLASMPVIIPRHVKRSTNKLADWLANESLRIKEDSWDKP